MAYNSANRSERLLQNRRFTTDGNTLTQEAFTQVLDLGVSEIYLDTAFIPTGSSQIPYSGSSQDQRIISASIVSPSIVVNLPIAKYWNRKKMKPAGDGTRQVYYFTLSNPSSPTNSVASDQLIESDQQTANMYMRGIFSIIYRDTDYKNTNELQDFIAGVVNATSTDKDDILNALKDYARANPEKMQELNIQISKMTEPLRPTKFNTTSALTPDAYKSGQGRGGWQGD